MSYVSGVASFRVAGWKMQRLCDALHLFALMSNVFDCGGMVPHVTGSCRCRVSRR
jgi:hypothetical protein